MSRIEERMKKSIGGAVSAHKSGAKGKSLPSNPQAPKYVGPHRHCTICQTPIHKDADPPVCDDSKCIAKHGKQETSRKRLNIMLYLFPAIAIMLFLLPFVT